MENLMDHQCLLQDQEHYRQMVFARSRNQVCGVGAMQ